ncbi:MAG: transposase [Ignavibacteriae bacterium]|nr:transposase [Ignavibacteriota bacterium]
MEEKENHLTFFTATILNWNHLLKFDKYKDIIVKSLKFLVNEKRVVLSAFVIMPNHIHIVWRINKELKYEYVQRDFLKYTSQMILNDLKKYHPLRLKKFYVNAKDRKYQIWERNPLSVNIFSEKVAFQKINYIHMNPLQEGWNLCELPNLYRYSSARFYYDGIDDWGILTHCLENYY